jgi:putative colanic acid biosynthesis acetyltransferase WcaF
MHMPEFRDDKSMEDPESKPFPQVNVASFENPYSFAHKCGRVLWGFVWIVLFRPSPRPCFGWRSILLRCFGARLGTAVHVYPRAKIWAPWNLEMGDHSCLADDVDCYCAGRIAIGAHATVSQYSYLCAAGHDISDPRMKLVIEPITIGDGAWVCAGAFVGPGVSVGNGAVVGARAVVVKNVDAWTVVGGNPAKFIKNRELKNRESRDGKPDDSKPAT